MSAILDTSLIFENLPPAVEVQPYLDANGAGSALRIPPGLYIEEPIIIRYRENGAPLQSHIRVTAQRGARATILERFESPTNQRVESSVEIIAEEHSHVSYVTLQMLPHAEHFAARRTSRCERGATVAWANADLGANAASSSLDAVIAGEGAHTDLAIVFFPNGSQHIDVVSTIEHQSGHSTSDTIVKSAATDRGQGTYLGIIRIAKDAQGTDARLRDDALLLSEHARIDSIPALEIAANDVKAFHGATVGAIDTELLFYMESRGIPSQQATNMIALGFFEPAIDRFPTEPLREEIRAALSAKIT